MVSENDHPLNGIFYIIKQRTVILLMSNFLLDNTNMKVKKHTRARDADASQAPVQVVLVAHFGRHSLPCHVFCTLEPKYIVKH